MRTVVPVSGAAPKSRLSSVLTADERREFTEAMLSDVVTALESAGRLPDVVSTAPIPCDAPVTVDERGLDALVNDRLAEADGRLAVVMADLPLLTADTVDRLFEPDAAVVLAPGLGGGTNAIVSRHERFRVDYHGVSIRDHRQRAAAIGASLAEVDSRRLAIDIDEPDDLAELLVHGDGAATDWLRDAGFELTVDEGRVGVTRE